jgi:acyl carrier protein
MSDPMLGGLGEIEQWLLERAKRIEGVRLDAIDPDFDLVDSGLIDSLRLVEFAYLVGRLTGRRLDPRELKLDQFRTLRKIGELRTVRSRS